MTIDHRAAGCLPATAKTVVSLPACPGRIVEIALSAGDTIRADRGLVWYTIDGQLDDVFLAAGEQRTIADDTTVSVTGFGRTDFSLISSRPRPSFVARGGVRPYAQRGLLERAFKGPLESLLRGLLAKSREELAVAARWLRAAPANRAAH